MRQCYFLADLALLAFSLVVLFKMNRGQDRLQTHAKIFAMQIQTIISIQENFIRS